MVPRKISGIRIDESDYFEDREEDETAAWRAHLVEIMSHFSTMSELTIGFLDLARFPAERRTQVLRPGQAQRALIVQWLRVEHAGEATSFILNQPDITFLGIGAVTLARNANEKDGKDEERVEEEEGGETVENDSVAIVALPPSWTEPTVRLDRLRHLCLFSDSGRLTWSHVVPLLAEGTLAELTTLIAECHDREAFVRLIGAAAPALRSLAVSFNGPGVDIDISKARSLTNLSIGLAMYPANEHVLADTVATISSAPPTVERVFLNIGPTTIETEQQLDGASLLWATLDNRLVAMPQLRRVIIIIVFDNCISMLMGMTGGSGGFVEKWKLDALNYIRKWLPLCEAKGLVEVKDATGSWTTSAFAGYNLPEKTAWRTV